MAPQLRADYYEREAELMRRLARDGQSPEAVFIGCSDSRMVPEVVVGAKPGDLFVLRSVANVVPPFGTGESGPGAALEYAVRRLDVTHLILCGHFDRGGIRALDTHLDLAAEPTLARWLDWARPAQTHVDATNVTEPGERHRRIVEANVVLQLANVRTYACVAQALEADELELHGWVFDIGTGQAWSLNPTAGTFDLLEAAA